MMTPEVKAEPQGKKKGELLYNGIILPQEWPPRTIDPESHEPTAVPYLASPPAVIPIDVGRQLFVDDFLIEKSTLRRTFHAADKHKGNPLLVPETDLELNSENQDSLWKAASGACVFDDAVIYDPRDELFKMWYQAGHRYATALVTSRDGLHWERPQLDVLTGTNCVIPYDPDFTRDSFSPWLDHEAADPEERFKAFLYTRSKRFGNGGWLYTSPDGVHWDQRARLRGSIGDNTSLFYNPFRRRWVLSVRRSLPERGRSRYYWEQAEFLRLADFATNDPIFWVGPDRLDEPDPNWLAQDPTQLYGVAAAPYESIMLGVFTVHYGPHNEICSEGGFPKLTQLKIGYSRDGFHWTRPDREVFVAASQREGDWDRAYLRAAGGGCLVVGDRLHCYYCGFSGITPNDGGHMYAGGSTQVAFLRRDGFVSMDADAQPAELITRPVTFRGRHLFVNLDAPHGQLRVAILDRNDRAIEPFTLDNCVPVSTDKTLIPVAWQGADDLSALSGNPGKFLFQLANGQLYAFWVSPDPSGASYGYVAAGGPGFTGPVDTRSLKA